MSARGAAENQLNNYKKSLKCPVGSVTTKGGTPIGIRDGIQTVGPRGPVLMQDVNFFDEITAFTRERVPERVVHAKGAGAFGTFKVTTDFITKYTDAKIFEAIGKETPMAIRMSTVGGESGSADTARDPRGFAVKFYTDDGIWDMVGNNTPIFFIREPILFPSFIHTQKRNPTTHLKDPDMVWDFFTLRPETLHQTLFHFSDRGTPDGYRFMNGYGSHTYKLTKIGQEPVYVKWHFKTDQKIKNLSAKKAEELGGTDPDYAIRDLFNAIETKNFPSWTLKVQIMTFAQAKTFKFNPFDMTKVWPQGEYPLHEVGVMTLNRNPSNYFTQVEQIGFSPAHLVPGIEASPDKMLQARLFAYADTQRYRIGPNHEQLPVNCPYRIKAQNYQRDGAMCFTDNQAGAPNYFPNSFGGPIEDERARKLVHKEQFAGDIYAYSTLDTEDDYSQPAIFYSKVLNEDERKRLIENITGHLSTASEFLQERAVKLFSKVSDDLGARLKEGLKLKSSANF